MDTHSADSNEWQRPREALIAGGGGQFPEVLSQQSEVLSRAEISSITSIAPPVIIKDNCEINLYHHPCPLLFA